METFGRFEPLIGTEGLSLLCRSHVMVVGVGGVGGGAAETLVRSGIGKITLVDSDEVEVSNLNRQFCAVTSRIGQPKVIAMGERMRDINPDCTVIERNFRVTEENLSELFAEPVDFVADCIDDMNAKTALILYCKRNGIPIISSMGAGNRMDPTKVTVTDIFKTENDPVARILRKKMRDNGIAHLTVAASTELPEKHRIENSSGGFSPASSPFVPPVFGIVMASHIVRSLLATEK